METGPNSSEMPESRWSLIAEVQIATTSRRRLALNELLRLYYPALRAHLGRRMRLDDATADDIVQGFIADKILDRDLLAAADPSKGRFRSLLLRSLTNYTIDVLRQRWPGRGRESPVLSEEDLDTIKASAKPTIDPFDVAWAREVLMQTLRNMRAECDAQGCRQRWLLFHRRLLQPLFEGQEPPAYDDLLHEFQFASPQQASNALITAKRHFHRVLCHVVGEYAEGDAEIARELMDLQTIVETAGPLGVHLGEFVAVDAADDFFLQHEESTHDAKQLAELFTSESQAESLWRAEDYPGLWRHQLEQPLANVPALVDVLWRGRSLAPGSHEDRPVTVEHLLAHEAPPIEALLALKEAARGYVHAGRSDFPAEIATALYFASIAAGLVRWQVRISKSDDVVLEYGFRLLATRPWLDDDTRRLVICASDQLQPSDTGS